MHVNRRGDVDGVSITTHERACQIRPRGNAIKCALNGIASNQSGELAARLDQDCWNDALRCNVAYADDLFARGELSAVFAPPTVLAKLVDGTRHARIDGIKCVFCGTATLQKISSQ